jgi:hypothetical protein
MRMGYGSTSVLRSGELSRGGGDAYGRERGLRASKPMIDKRSTPPLLSEVAFSFARELVGLLKRENRPDLAARVPGLRVVEIRNHDDQAGSVVHTSGRRVRWGLGRRDTIGLLPQRGVVNVDLIEGKIVSIRTFDRPDLGEALLSATLDSGRRTIAQDPR